MTAKGHVLLALPPSIIWAQTLGLSGIEAGALIAAVAAGSLFPDVDEPNSFIGRRLMFMSWTIKILSLFFPTFRHRGVTHIFLVPLSIILIGSAFENILVAAFGLGWLMHTVGDLITVGGVRGYFYPLWPDQKIVLLPDGFRFYTNGFIEHFFNTFLLLINGYLMASFQGLI
ncbi:hypothetical protein E0765_03585 [Sulfuricurvum sp. IAE1]|uniref:metal-dependent hydrolase n=1 Tax=Sulfuricurvum sp. IAE1 TaxID=2546102 RepID=UPI00104619CE|nr:metal-dependent hydrolase [Sulfuricurvum sp. IAE1]TDA67315.1 hypothetical protein E0765_03585 [Sulfuricurvum sp. IAE1]